MPELQAAERPGPVLRRQPPPVESPRSTPLIRLAWIGSGIALLTLLAGWLFLSPEEVEPIGGDPMTLNDFKSAKPLRLTGLLNLDDRESTATDAASSVAPVTENAPAQPNEPLKVETDADALAPASGDPAAAAAQPVVAEPLVAKGPALVIVLTEAGESASATRTAIAQLPNAITLGFSPYAKDARSLAHLARQDGHEVLIGLPMQPKAYPAISPGEQSLLVGQTPEQLRQRLDWALGRIGENDGVYTMMGSAFTTSRKDYAALLKMLGARGVPIVDARSIGSTLGPSLAKETGVTLYLNNSFVEGDAAEARRMLADLLTTAKRDGKAIGFIKATPAMVEMLDAWLPQAERAGVRLATLSGL
jgi:uncharacterized protein